MKSLSANINEALVKKHIPVVWSNSIFNININDINQYTKDNPLKISKNLSVYTSITIKTNDQPTVDLLNEAFRILNTILGSRNLDNLAINTISIIGITSTAILMFEKNNEVHSCLTLNENGKSLFVETKGKGIKIEGNEDLIYKKLCE